MSRCIRLLPLALFAIALAFNVGCDSSTVKGPAGTKLKIVKPMDQTLSRGKTDDVSVLIARDEFSGSVALEVSQLPSGVHVTNTKLEIPGTDKSAMITLHADPQAVLVTNHRVLVTAKAVGLEVTEAFNLTVKE